ncbi:hypothetical protein PMAYCL1PPCAC_10938, partial [Pristionchus mayeri]
LDNSRMYRLEEATKVDGEDGVFPTINYTCVLRRCASGSHESGARVHLRTSGGQISQSKEKSGSAVEVEAVSSSLCCFSCACNLLSDAHTLPHALHSNRREVEGESLSSPKLHEPMSESVSGVGSFSWM